jgi:predicted transcriptional regulator
MTTLTIKLSPEMYEQLHAEAERSHQSAEAVVQRWLAERLNTAIPAAPDERKRTREVLRAAGLLAELSPALRKRAESSTATLEEVSAALERAGGRPLSEIVLEQRGLKE